MLIFEFFNSFYIDPTCVLLPPHRKKAALSPALKALVIGSLSQRYQVDRDVIHQYLGNIEEYGTVSITLGGADTLHAFAVGSHPLDWRDNTFVRVSDLHLYVKLV
jgi:hypothetical protein